MRRLLIRVLLGLSLAGFAITSVFYGRAVHNYKVMQLGTLDAYTQLLNDSSVRPYVLYNLGNYYFEEGVKQQDVTLVRRAQAYYREALRLHPDFLEAKKNYEIVNRLLRPKDPDGTNIQKAKPDQATENLRPGLLPPGLDI